MSTIRKPYPSDGSSEEWSFVAPYLALLPEDVGQRKHDLREVFNGLRMQFTDYFIVMQVDQAGLFLEDEHNRSVTALPRCCLSSDRTVRAMPCQVMASEMLADGR
jgi:hypothetical protein